MRTARGVAAVAAAVLAVALSACMPTPAPTPTPTGFASEEEAFAAAEATYRAYVDALNEARTGGDADPYDFLTGQALEAEIASEREFEAAGIRLEGPLVIVSVRPLSAAATHALIQICLDVSGTRVLDVDDLDVTPAERDGVLGLDIETRWTPRTTLVSSTTTSNEPC